MLKLKILGCNGGGEKNKGLTSFLLNDEILFDAGNVITSLSLEAQEKISHIFVSHSHLDHIRDIPLLADNFVEIPGKKIIVYGLEETIISLKNHLFNNVIFPDFTMIPHNAPVIKYEILMNKKPVIVNGFSITPIKLNHTVPCVGYIVEKENIGFAYISDTFKTNDIFLEINNRQNIKFIIIEASFQNNQKVLAEISKHLTPEILLNEIEKIERNDIEIYIYHKKPRFSKKIEEEIKNLTTQKSISFLKDNMVIKI